MNSIKSDKNIRAIIKIMGDLYDDVFGSRERRSWYDVAQICLNGHVVNRSVKESPQFCEKFCNECGAKTITKCQNCEANIKGEYHVEGGANFLPFPAPAFCTNCGKAYPWTDAKIQVAHESAQELENISIDEKKILAQSIDDISTDNPRNELAAIKIKKILPKAKGEGVNVFKKTLGDVASEAAKKLLFG